MVVRRVAGFRFRSWNVGIFGADGGSVRGVFGLGEGWVIAVLFCTIVVVIVDGDGNGSILFGDGCGR